MRHVTGNGPVERWGVYEIALQGPSGRTGSRGSRGLNPFTDVALSARFRRGGLVRDVRGFYDGEGAGPAAVRGDRPQEKARRLRAPVPYPCRAARSARSMARTRELRALL